MMDCEDVLKNREALQYFLQKVSANDLADAISTKRNVIALVADGVRVITISNNSSQTA